MSDLFDRRPIPVAVAGPNGAGKTTFHDAHHRAAGLRFVNADDIARTLVIDSYAAGEAAREVRRALVEERESFVFETVLSDPAGGKVAFLSAAAGLGYAVVLCYIGLDSAERSVERVAMRVLQGGHDVPDAKLRARYRQSLWDLARAVRGLPHVVVYENSDLAHPFREVARFEPGKAVSVATPAPRWLPRVR